jgi:carbon monoxide dehydrogenase subunit G
VSTRGFQARVEIRRPPAEVWRAITDFSCAGAWMPGVSRMTPLDDAPMAEGKRYDCAFAASGRGKSTVVTLAEWQPAQMCFALSSAQSGMHMRYRYSVSASGDGTTVRLDATTEARAPMMRLFHPIIGFLMAKHDSRQLPMLKQMLEAEA